MSHNKSLSSAFLLIAIIFALSFVLVLLFPSKPPKIVDVVVPDSAVDPQIRITFSKPMDKNSLADGGIIFTPKIAGDISWTGNTLVYTPKNNLEFGKEYKLQINTAGRSISGEYLAKITQHNFKTADLDLLYISEDQDPGRLMSYNITTNRSEAISPKGYEIEKYDYDHLSGNILLLASGSGEKTINPYLLDKKTGDFSNIENVSSDEYKIHYLKWLPYENSILLSRTKILFKNSDGSVNTLSQEPLDTELVLYNFDSNKSRIIKTGNALLYEFFPSPDGRKISFINDDGAFTFKDIADGKESLIATAFINYFGFSPHGKYAIYLLANEFSTFTLKTDIVLQDSAGEKKVITLDEVDCDVDKPTISFNEQLLAFKYKPAYEDYRLALVDLKDGKLNLITEKNSDIDYPFFAPNDEHLAFTQKNELGLNEIAFYLLKNKEFSETDIHGHDLEWSY